MSHCFNDSKQKRMALHCRKKKLSALSRGISSKNNGDVYCLNCFHWFRAKNKLESHKKLCKNIDFCNAVIPSGDNKKLVFNRYQKSDLIPFIIYADLGFLLEKKWINVKIILENYLLQK